MAERGSSEARVWDEESDPVSTEISGDETTDAAVDGTPLTRLERALLAVQSVTPSSPLLDVMRRRGFGYLLDRHQANETTSSFPNPTTDRSTRPAQPRP